MHRPTPVAHAPLAITDRHRKSAADLSREMLTHASGALTATLTR